MDANVGQLFIPVVEKAHFESFCGIPVKQIRDNAITGMDVKDSKLGPCGGVILAHCLKSNSSVTVVEASSCGMGTAGAKAFGDVLRVNKTLQHLNVSNNSFGKMQVGDQVKLKSNGEMCTVHRMYYNGNPCITKADGSTKDDVRPLSMSGRARCPLCVLDWLLRHLCCR